MTPVVAVWAIAPAIIAAHVVRSVLADRRDRRRARRAVKAYGRLTLVPRDELADRREQRDRIGGAA